MCINIVFTERSKSDNYDIVQGSRHSSSQSVDLLRKYGNPDKLIDKNNKPRSLENKELDLKKIRKKQMLDIAVITETKEKLKRTKDLDDYTMVYSGVPQNKRESPTEDKRGEILVECLEELAQETVNVGDKPTFIRGETKSQWCKQEDAKNNETDFNDERDFVKVDDTTLSKLQKTLKETKNRKAIEIDEINAE
ncbi:hypothetical protein ILUMI_03272 [Ignelater luminosus]|uniref:Uncharacterized protein n=1 Tax=Ignelater luminosus TaxID=2038154 RepID=A0A8K0DEV8_IGNLU|nr:hypothetical protein ILUMI_03272 [Ignelater luminosus]